MNSAVNPCDVQDEREAAGVAETSLAAHLSAVRTDLAGLAHALNLARCSKAAMVVQSAVLALDEVSNISDSENIAWPPRLFLNDGEQELAWVNQ